MKKFWLDVSVGDYLESLQKPKISRLQIAHYSVAFNEFSPLQLDDDYAKNAGFNSVFASNLMSLSVAQEMINNFAQNITLISLSSTFQRLLWPGDTILAKGLIVQHYQKNQEFRVGLTIWCENQAGEIIMKGLANLLMFKDALEQKNSLSGVPEISLDSREWLKNKYSMWFKEKNKSDKVLV